MNFTTHVGEIVSGNRLQVALNRVADDWAQLGRDIHACGDYASHVSQGVKDDNLSDMLAQAERIRAGEVLSLTIAQRINTALTGKCVALLP